MLGISSHALSNGAMLEPALGHRSRVYCVSASLRYCSRGFHSIRVGSSYVRDAARSKYGFYSSRRRPYVCWDGFSGMGNQSTLKKIGVRVLPGNSALDLACRVLTRRNCSTVSHDSGVSRKDPEVDIPVAKSRKLVLPSGLDSEANVRAYYIAKNINVVKMFQHLYGKQKHMLKSDALVMSFPQEPSSLEDKSVNTVDEGGDRASVDPVTSEYGASNGNTESDSASGISQTEQSLSPSYAVYYEYGSVVLFNCSNALQAECISKAEKFSDGFMVAGEACSDEYRVDVDQSLDSWSSFKANRLVLRSLDINNVRVISSVMAQSVAMAHFEHAVDEMLASFEKVNENSTALSGVGGYKSGHNKFIFKLLHESNAVLSQVIIKLGVLDRTRMRDTAWKYEKYFEVWEGLRVEYEIDDRWSSMTTKIDHMQHNMHFSVELLHTHKSERLEWMIIFLIAMELLVSVYGLYKGVH